MRYSAVRARCMRHAPRPGACVRAGAAAWRRSTRSRWRIGLRPGRGGEGGRRARSGASRCCCCPSRSWWRSSTCSWPATASRSSPRLGDIPPVRPRRPDARGLCLRLPVRPAAAARRDRLLRATPRRSTPTTCCGSSAAPRCARRWPPRSPPAWCPSWPPTRAGSTTRGAAGPTAAASRAGARAWGAAGGRQGRAGPGAGRRGHARGPRLRHGGADARRRSGRPWSRHDLAFLGSAVVGRRADIGARPSRVADPTPTG